jgi:hypothetical protein
MSDTPEHRTAFPARSGDTIVIGKDGKEHNVDQEARDDAARSAKKKASAKPKVKKPAARRKAAPTPAPTPAPTDQ